MAQQQTIWTLEAVIALRDLISLRHSASIISQELTEKFQKEFTRNAVIGKTHRLQVDKQKPLVKHEYTRKKYTVTKDISSFSPLKLRIGQLDAASNHFLCRCVDRDDTGEATYCGLPTVFSSSWCEWHHEIFTVLPKERRVG